MAKTDDVFTVFISHKHDDHALALEVKKALQGLAGPKPIDCFVSGTDITAGMDWRREIRSVLARSHEEPGWPKSGGPAGFLRAWRGILAVIRPRGTKARAGSE